MPPTKDHSSPHAGSPAERKDHVGPEWAAGESFLASVEFHETLESKGDDGFVSCLNEASVEREVWKAQPDSPRSGTNSNVFAFGKY